MKLTLSIYVVEYQSVGSPSESTHSSPDLLDLESVSYTSWEDIPTHDITDPDWLPSDVSKKNNSMSKVCSRNSPNSSTVKPCHNHSSPPTSKANKRRNSSLTSEIELQVEIEESTKRAKVRLFTTCLL